MIKFYDFKEDIPKDIPCVDDNVSYFNKYTIHKLNEDVDNLLKHTDKCTYQDKMYFKDRFGHSLRWDQLSTGGMTTLNVHYNPNVAFSGIECGNNAFADISKLKDGYMYKAAAWADSYDEPLEFMYNDEVFHSVREALDAYK